MARSKNTRSRASKQPQHQTTCNLKHTLCRCVHCVTDRNLAGKNGTEPASLGHRNPQDVHYTIAYHWKVLSADVKPFLLDRPRSFIDFVNFWSEPHRIENAKGSCASSISGSSWFLALNYLFLDKLVEAQALMINGSFMHECTRRPIESIVALCNTTHRQSEEVFLQQFPTWHDAYKSSHNKQSMEAFLLKALPPNYRRQMSFASQAGKSTGHSIVGNFVNFISNDWNGSSSPSAAAARRQVKGVDSNSIQVVLMNSDTNEAVNVTIGMLTTLKSIFNNYADEQGVSLRSLRFTHNEKMLFLSSAGNKTAAQLDIKHLDSIHISSTTPPPAQVASRPVQPKSPSRTNKKSKGKRAKKQNMATPAVITTNFHEQDKIKHSNQLSHVFDEAQPLLKSIRQRLNSLNIERTLPKQRRSGQKKSKASVSPILNPSTAGIGGKAGKSHFVVQVGESSNLYKTMKRPARSLQQQKPIVTDLHGLTKEEALSKLNSSLPQWTDIAMQGSYPFVIPVKIVCGGGSQVLSEAVENWVRQKGNVCIAPKNLYAA